MIKKIKELLKALYLRVSCAFCCKSKCQVQIGKEEDKKAKEQVKELQYHLSNI
jgi:hypothetical protein